MLGQPDPDEMLAGMDEQTYQKWARFFAEEPFGPQVQNLLLAQAAAAAAGGETADFLPLTVDPNGPANG